MPKIPQSRQVLDRIEATNQANGHENGGPLSHKSGFLPNPPPLLSLPPEYRAWDELAGNLPQHFSNLTFRREADRLPLLGAGPDSLPDKYLWRASCVISMLAHSYQRSELTPPAQLPRSITQPWVEISTRLGKPYPYMSYMDLIMYNWKLRDPELPPVLENMDLLIPTVGTETERVFYLTQVEIAYRFVPIIEAIIQSQAAALNDDPATLERELLIILECLQQISHVTFQKIDPNPHSRTAVDQVIWAKTVAPFGVAINPDHPSPSGTAAPVFHLMDAFFSRRDFETVLGQESDRLNTLSPVAWQEFVRAVSKTSVLDYIQRYDYRSLRGLFYQVMDAFAGDKGYLGVHRLKVMGFLETAFKAGRSVTMMKGFSGLFRNKTWTKIDRELELTRDERYNVLAHHSYSAQVIFGASFTDPQTKNKINFIQLDLTNTGLRYRPGDRVGIFPENKPELVEKTLRALQANGDEKVELSRAWRTALQRLSHNYTPIQPLRTIIRFGNVRPVTRQMANQLYNLTASNFLKKVINERAEDQWELWDLLEELRKGGYDTRRLWKAGPAEAESICRIVRPEEFRLYSIASSPSTSPNPDQTGHRLSLIVGGLKYKTPASPVTRDEERFGTASNFLEQMTDPEKTRTSNSKIPIKLVTATNFSLPADPTRPIVMFAAGSGIAPFSGFLQARANQPGKNWLFFATRNPDQIFYQPEFETLVKAGKLQLSVAFSASDKRLKFNGEHLVLEPGKRAHIQDLMLEEENARTLWDMMRSRHEGGQGAIFYICGQTGFARTVMNTLRQIMERFSPNYQTARERFYNLVADRRFLQDIFTTYSPTFQNQNFINISDVVRHNNAERGYWAVINNKVYDLTEFGHLHPGGMSIIINNAGIDATSAYQAVLHHVNSEVDALLGIYEIGVLRPLNFGQEWLVGVNEQGLFHFTLEEAFTRWVKLLYLITEMQNSINVDYSFLDKKLTVVDRPEEITPFKLQYLIEVHQRVFTNYLNSLLEEDLPEIWQYGLGFYLNQIRIDYLPQIFKNIRQHSIFEVASQVSSYMQHLLQTGQLNLLIEFSDKVVVEDRRLFSELKGALRVGVKVFETHQRESARQGQAGLYDSLMRIPNIVHQYYNRLTEHLEQVKKVAPPSGPRLSTKVQPTAMPPQGMEFQGHGSTLTQFTPPQDNELP
ncbi:MAG TPA: cytochrome b5 domain-containing protein [Chloroflexia bacterium]|nr:cytochrome b5 domain-containing protein [Chloroflexia bacterium]